LIIWDISELLAVVFRNNESVAFAEGVDVEECENGGGFVELEGGDVSCLTTY